MLNFIRNSSTFSRWIPRVITQPTVDLRKSSAKMLSDFFGAIIYLCGRDSSAYGLQLLATVKSVITALDTLFQVDLDEFFVACKESLIFYRNFMVGKWLSRDILKVPRHRWEVWEGNDGFPKLIAPICRLRIFIEASMQSPNSPIGSVNLLFLDRIAMALLSCWRVVRVSATVNTESITAPYTGVPDCISQSEVSSALESLGITVAAFRERYTNECANAVPHISASSGPNGQATWNAHLDAVAMLNQIGLYMHFVSWCERSGLSHFVELLHGSVVFDKGSGSRTDVRVTGRIHVIEELGGKSRHIAIGDYFTQAVLSPLHNTLNSFLRSIESDGTFDQEKLAETVRRWTESSTTGIWCYDLTTATDRLPRWLQVTILNWLGPGSDFGKLWARLIADRDFRTPDGTDVSYTVGQPMGLKSSFPMLALAHHVIVQVAASRVGLQGFTEYVILGDDIAIRNERVAGEYASIMGKLGLEISSIKSVISAPGETAAAEICKRVFVEGVEYTSLPPKLISKCVSNGRLAPDLHNELLRRGMFQPNMELFEFMNALLDPESFSDYTRLNLLPTSITPLTQRIELNTPMNDPANWYDEYKLSETDLRNVYLYGVAVESLKRVDALIRNSADIESTIQSMIDTGNVGFTSLDLVARTDDKYKELVLRLKDLHPTHPAVMASRAEVRRVTELLANLQSGDLSLANLCLAELVDTFRNSLTELARNGSDGSAVASNSLVGRMLRNLDTIVMDRRDHSLIFTSLIVTVRRVWTVAYKLGTHLSINSVQTRVSTFALDVHNRTNQVLSSISVSPRKRGL